MTPHQMELEATAPAASTFLVDELINDRFRIVRLLGVGGMGEVYEAFDETLETRVALKTLRQHIAGDPDSHARFKREILLAHRVTHPNVCRTFDAGVVDGIPFLTMELLRGETLAARLARVGRMSPADVLPIAAQVAAGLAAAHQVGVVHRDFKSANVILVDNPALPRERAAAGDEVRAVVSDFGIARLWDPQASSAQASGAIGSPAYMAPEQVEGLALGPATDIYAFGIVLYELITGALPFAAATPMATAMQRLQRPAPSPRARVPSLPLHWDAAIRRCLERDPAKRFAAIGDVVEALATPGPARRRWRAVAIALGAAAAAAALAVGLAMGRDTPAHAAEDPARAFDEASARLDRLDCAAGRAALLALIQRAPQHAAAHARLAEAERCLSHDDAAAARATTALQLAGTLPAPDRLRIQAAYWTALGEAARAAPLDAQLFEARPTLATGQALLEAQIDAYDLPAARATLAKLQRMGGGEDARTLLLEAGLLLAEFANPAEAILKAESAVACAKARDERGLIASALALELEALDRLGQLRRGIALAQEAQARAAALGDDGLAAEIAEHHSDLLRRTGELAASEARARAAIAFAERAGSTSLLRKARNALRQTARERGDFHEARAALLLVQHADELARQPRNVARMLSLDAVAHLAQGKAIEALALRDRAAATADDPTFLAQENLAVAMVARLAFAQDDLATARTAFEDQLVTRQRFQDWPMVADVRLWLADVAFAAGDLGGAEGHAQSALELFDRADEPDEAALARVVLGRVAWARGDRAAATAYIERAGQRRARTERPRVRAIIAAAAAELAAQDPAKRADAEAALARAITDAEAVGLAEALDLRLLLGKLEHARGSSTRLRTLVREATARGMLRVAHLATAALGMR